LPQALSPQFQLTKDVLVGRESFSPGFIELAADGESGRRVQALCRSPQQPIIVDLNELVVMVVEAGVVEQVEGRMEDGVCPGAHEITVDAASAVHKFLKKGDI
jgi:hypothetical protein